MQHNEAKNGKIIQQLEMIVGFVDLNSSGVLSTTKMSSCGKHSIGSEVKVVSSSWTSNRVQVQASLGSRSRECRDVSIHDFTSGKPCTPPPAFDMIC